MKDIHLITILENEIYKCSYGPFQLTENKGQHEKEAHKISSIPDFSGLEKVAPHRP
jgi:hypothetical protein